LGKRKEAAMPVEVFLIAAVIGSAPLLAWGLAICGTSYNPFVKQKFKKFN